MRYIRNATHPCPNHRWSWAWASYQIREIAGCACAVNAGNVFPATRFQRKSLVSDPDMHHGTCVTHVPWCMSGSLTHGGGKIVPGVPGACATPNFTYLVRGPRGSYYIPRGASGNVKLSNKTIEIDIISGQYSYIAIFRDANLSTSFYWWISLICDGNYNGLNGLFDCIS